MSDGRVVLGQIMLTLMVQNDWPCEPFLLTIFIKYRASLLDKIPCLLFKHQVNRGIRPLDFTIDI